MLNNQDSTPSPPPETIGAYRLLEPLGEGASSVVYKAYHITDPMQQAAIKLTRTVWNEADIETRVRFEHEADLLSRLSHDSIVKLHRFGVHDGLLYLVMELAPGRALSKLLANRAGLSMTDIVSILRQTAAALAHAHAKGILHRDIKPSNVVVALSHGEPKVKVLDFGLSRLKSHAGSAPTGGTFLYMSPEQLGILNQPADERSDLYSLGMMAVELINGHHPFSGQGVRDLIHSHAAVIPDLAPDTPEALKNIVLAMIKKDPAERYASARQLEKDLELCEGRLRRGETGVFPLHLGEVGSKLGFPKFLGRQPAVDALREVYSVAKTMKRGVGLLSGPSGCGKTRLLSELCQTWTNSVVLWGRGREYGQASAYGLIAESLRRLSPEILPPASVDRIRNSVSDRGSDLLRLVPELIPLLPAKMDSTELTPERRQQRFFKVVVDLLQSLGDPQAPLVLVLDDIQWADGGSLQLIRQMLESPQSGAVLVLASLRTGGPPLEEAPQSFLEAVGHLPEAHTVQIDPLAQSQIETLVESMLGTAAPEISQAVSERAQGNPLYAVEFLRSLVDTGTIVGGPTGWKVVHPDRMQDGFEAGGLSANILARFENLTNDHREILFLASVLGNPFHFDTLVSALSIHRNLKEEEAGRRVADGLEAATTARLVEASPQTGEYVFIHHKVRESIFQSMEAERRSAAHRSIGLALEQSPSPDEHLFDLAYHFGATDDTDRALRYALRAGDLSQERYAHREALAYYDHVQRILESLPPGVQRQAWDVHLWESRGDAERMLGHYTVALPWYEKALPFLQNIGERVRLETKIGRTLFSMGESRRAGQALEGALRQMGQRLPQSRLGIILGLLWELIIQFWHSARPRRSPPRSSPSDVLVARLLDELCHVYYFTDRIKVLHTHLRHLNFAERCQVPEVLAQAYCNHGPACSTVGFMKRGVRYLNMGLQIRQQLGDRWGVAQARSYLCAVLFLNMDWHESIRQGQLAEPDFEELGDRWELTTLLLSLSTVLGFYGDFNQAEAYLDRAYRLAAISKNLSGMAIAIRGKSYLLGRIDPHRLLEDATSLLPACRAAGDFTALCGLLIASGIACRFLGRYKEAVRFLEEGAELKKTHPIARGGTLPFYPGLVRTLVEWASRTRDPEEREALIVRAGKALRKARWESWIRDSPLVRCDYLLARAALLNLRGHSHTAESTWREAFLSALEIGGLSDQARALSQWGEGLISQDPVKGERLFRLAWPIYQRLGCQLDLDRLAHHLPDLAAKSSSVSVKPSRSQTGSSSHHGNVVETERLETLIEVAVELSRILDLDELLDRVVKDAARIFGAERAFLYLMDEKESGFRQRGVFRSREGEETTRPVPASILNQLMTQGKALLSDDAQLDAQINISESVVSSGVHSFMAVPLKSQGHLRGALYLDNRLLKGLFSKHDLKILEAFGSQAAVALENANLFAKQERTQSDLKQLYDASRELMGVLDRRVIFSSLVARSRALTGAQAAAVVLWEEGRPAVRLQHQFTPLQIGEIESLALTDKTQDIHGHRLKDGTTLTLVPLWVGDTREGILMATVDDTLPRTRDLLSHLGTQCSLALHNARLYEMAITDEMTQVYQRRYYEMVLSNLSERRSPYSLILIDLNDFKLVNDTRGHAVGDQVLKAVGRALRQTLRANDLAARIGGDEFAVILTEQSEEGTRQVVEKLRQAIAAIRIENPGQDPPRVWASFGYAMSEEGDLATLKVTADQRLYEDKRQGKAHRKT